MRILAQIRKFLWLGLGIGLAFPGAYGLQNIGVYGLIAISLLELSIEKSTRYPLLFWISMGYFFYLLGFEWYADQNWPAFLKKIPLLLSVLWLKLPTESEKDLFYKTVGISTIISCLFLWGHHFWELVPQERFLLRSYSYNFLTESLGWQPIYTAISYAIGALIGLDIIPKSPNKWIKLGGSIGILILFLTLIFLSARMALLGFLVSALFLVKSSKRWMIIAGVFVSGILIYLNPILRERVTKAVSGTEQYAGGNIRWEKWKAASTVISKHWLFGVSSGKSQQKLEEQYSKQNFQLGILEHYHAHQQWLQNALEGGIFGIFFLTITSVIFLRQGWNSNQKLLFALGIFLLTNALTESICERQSGMIWFCVIFLSGFVQKSDNPPTV